MHYYVCSAMTSHLISRNNEMNNSILMSQYGFNVETVILIKIIKINNKIFKWGNKFNSR